MSSKNDAKPILASPNIIEINLSYYTDKQALTSSTNLQNDVAYLIKAKQINVTEPGMDEIRHKSRFTNGKVAATI